MKKQVDLSAALERIAELNRTLGWDPAKDPVLSACVLPEAPSARPVAEDPVRAAADNLIQHMQDLIIQIGNNRASWNDRMERLTRMRDDATDEAWKREFQQSLAEDRPEFDKTMADLNEHESTLRAKIARLQADPHSMFLPLGTVVRFTSAPASVNSLSLLPRSADSQYPVPGSIGVVTGLNHDREYPIRVSLRRPFKDGYGNAYEPDYDHLPTFFVDREKVEVIGPGILPGGQPCKAYGYLPTYRRNEADAFSGPKDEMIIEADGFFWRLHDFGGTQGIEAIQAFENIEDMSWIGAPLDIEGPDEETVPCPGM